MLINPAPPDGGMLYAETDMAQFFPEPLNAVTAVLFLVVAVFWTIKIKDSFKVYPFLTYCLILLYIGAIGGTVYHSFRKWPVFIIMDWMPIMLLCLSAAVYFLAESTRWYYAVLTVVGYLTLMIVLRNYILTDNISLFINVNYGIMAFLVLLSVLSYLIYTKWKYGKWVGFAFFSFVFALTFRVADKWEWLSFGTHFLWHTFGTIAAFCMFNYIYLVQSGSADKNQSEG